jgi:integrase
MARVKLTAGRIAAFGCPQGKTQAFLWDTDAPGLGLRATAGGAKAYIFQSRFAGQGLRVTIGSPDAWAIGEARERARELQRQIDEGRDPREVKAQTAAADLAQREERSKRGLTVSEVWAVYMAEGKPRKKAAWKPRYRDDLMKAASPGGEPKKRGAGVTKPGHLAALMPLRLADINQDAIRDWYSNEAKRGPVQAARAVAMFSGFLSWCGTRKEFRGLVDKTAARASELADVLPAARRRVDKVELEQLPAWFASVDKLRNRTAATYLMGLILTGARRQELAALKWADVDFRWAKMSIADKVGDKRVVPLTPYFASLLRALPRLKDTNGDPNPYVFASPSAARGYIAEPRSAHDQVLADAGIRHVSIHGLRRAFALLGEEAGVPAGAIAQVMGHRPSAVSEGYKPRSIDALRRYLTRIEGFILERAGIEFDASAAAGGLRVVSA